MKEQWITIQKHLLTVETIQSMVSLLSANHSRVTTNHEWAIPKTWEQAVGNTLRAWTTSSSHARVTSTKSRIFLADNTSSSHTQVGLCRYRSCLLEVTAHGKGRKTLDIFLVSIWAESSCWFIFTAISYIWVKSLTNKGDKGEDATASITPPLAITWCQGRTRWWSCGRWWWR